MQFTHTVAILTVSWLLVWAPNGAAVQIGIAKTTPAVQSTLSTAPSVLGETTKASTSTTTETNIEKIGIDNETTVTASSSTTTSTTPKTSLEVITIQSIPVTTSAATTPATTETAIKNTTIGEVDGQTDRIRKKKWRRSHHDPLNTYYCPCDLTVSINTNSDLPEQVNYLFSVCVSYFVCITLGKLM